VHGYLGALLDSEFGLAPWVLGVACLTLAAATYSLTSYSRRALAAQTHIIIENDAAVSRVFQPRYVVAQLAFAAVTLSASYYIGEPAFTFIGGGYVVALAMTFGLNLHSLLFARRLQCSGSATGSVTLSSNLAVSDFGYRSLGGASVLFVTGLLLAQLALLGGALFLASAGVGYVRKSRKLRAQP
jgi:hypothetical protein